MEPVQPMDPMEQLVAIAATWERVCRRYFATEGACVAAVNYQEWMQHHCLRRRSSAEAEILLMRAADEARIASTDGGFTLCLLHRWWRAGVNTPVREDEVIKRLLPALGGPERQTRTMSRLLVALSRYGLVDRTRGRRADPTVVKISSRGLRLYSEFSEAYVDDTLSGAADNAGDAHHV